MAITTKRAVVKIRRRNFKIPRFMPDIPSMELEAASVRLSNPVRISSVEIIGLAFSGIFVSGMMAMQIAMKTLNAAG